jgi:hypothetical protein
MKGNAEMKTHQKKMAPNSKVGNRPSARTLQRFIDRGGYALLDSVGQGQTSVERQLNGWEQRSIKQRLKQKTRLSRPTLYRIQSWCPTDESTGLSTGIWIKPDDYQRLKNAYTALTDIEKELTEIQRYFERSLVIDLLKLQARRELLGETMENFQLALKQQVDAGEKQKSNMETLQDDAIHKVIVVQRDVAPVIR